MKINENISLEYIPMEKFKTSSISIYIHTPLTADTASNNALLTSILGEGCKMCPTSVDIEKYLEALYGANLVSSVTKIGNDHLLLFSLEGINNEYALDDEPILEKLARLALNVVFEPVTDGDGFRQDVFETEKKNCIARLESLRNNKRSYAQLRVLQEGCPSDDTYSVSRYGTIESFNKITNSELYAYYLNLIKSSKIDIFVTGKANIESITGKIGSYIKDIQFKNAALPKFDIIAHGGEVKTVHEQLDVTQGKLAMMFTTGVPIKGREKNIMRLAISIYGGGAHSKLFLNVREKLSLCYYAAASYDRFKGVVIVDAGIEFDKFKSAYDEILLQLEELKAGNISDEEFYAAKASLINSYTTLYDDEYAMAGFMLQSKISDEDISIESIISDISSVTKKEIVDISKNIKLNTVYFLEGKVNG